MSDLCHSFPNVSAGFQIGHFFWALRQEMDSEADAEYIQKRAQETIDSFLGGKDIDIKDKAAVKRQLKLTSEEVIQLKCLGRRFLTVKYLNTVYMFQKSRNWPWVLDGFSMF